MIPVKDHNPSGRTPLATYFLMAVNALVFIFSFGLPEKALMSFIQRYALIPALVTQGQQFSTLVTSMFLHGGWGHLAANMLFLNIFGDNLEDRLGHLKYLLYYLLCGLGASFLQIVISPGSTIPMLGASGAIAGIMGGYLLLFPRHQIDVLFSFGLVLRRASVPAYTMLFYWFIAQLFTGVGNLALVGAGYGGVAYFAHIGGFLTGYLSLAPFKRKLTQGFVPTKGRGWCIG